jgi:hypothetical protein
MRVLYALEYISSTRALQNWPNVLPCLLPQWASCRFNTWSEAMSLLHPAAWLRAPRAPRQQRSSGITYLVNGLVDVQVEYATQ